MKTKPMIFILLLISMGFNRYTFAQCQPCNMPEGGYAGCVP